MRCGEKMGCCPWSRLEKRSEETRRVDASDLQVSVTSPKDISHHMKPPTRIIMTRSKMISRTFRAGSKTTSFLSFVTFS